MYTPSRRIPGAAVAAALVGLFVASACAPVRPADPDMLLADARTSQRARASLLADPLVGGAAIGLEVHRGVATVTGEAPDREIARRVLEIVASTRGVQLVVDRLVVAEESPS